MIDVYRLPWLPYVAAALLSLGMTAGLSILLLDPRNALRGAWSRYEADLDRETRFLFMSVRGHRIARSQLVLSAVVLVAAYLTEEWVLVGLLPFIAILPRWILQRKHDQRIQKLEEQLDTWLLILSNALKAAPSLADAFGSSATLVRPPISQELDLALKQMKLGTPFDQAVLNMSHRIQSRVYSSALGTILVGRQTGGELPKILKQSAATLREMARLEGVVRSKTADGRNQAYVLASIPFVLLAAIHWIDEKWLAPLTSSVTGYLVLGIALVLWLAAIFWARRILAVDI